MDIQTVISEEVQRLFEQQVHTISDLAKTLERLGVDPNGQQVIQRMLLNVYKTGGDAGVIKMYQELAGVQIQALRNGRYMFSNLTGGGEDMLEEIEDNAFHTPDEMPS